MTTCDGIQHAAPCEEIATHSLQASRSIAAVRTHTWLGMPRELPESDSKGRSLFNDHSVRNTP